MSTIDYVGIDVSKAHLDVCLGEPGKVVRLGNDRAGLAQLARRLGHLAHPHVVCEATGSYTRLLHEQMARRGIAVSRINPLRIRHYGRALGQLAKTDAIDAGLIVRFALAMQPAATPLASPAQVQLTELVRRRRQLVDELARQKQREPGTAQPLVAASQRRHLDFLKAEIATLDAAIAEAVKADAQLAHRAELLRTIPGFGAVVAATLVAEMPELGQTGPKQIAALAGVAPFTNDSGAWRGQAHIKGGRLSVRCVLYMATIVAIRCNPPIKATYKHLRAQGKPPKLAITAAMRKLIVIANAMIANDTPWTHTHP